MKEDKKVELTEEQKNEFLVSYPQPRLVSRN